MEFTQASYEGEPCLQIVFRQQVMDAEMAKELDVLRQRDQVTGLFNRQHFIGELDGAIAAAAGGRGDQALLLLELDNYSALLNEIGLGHADQLLERTARRIDGALDERAISARFSDHGFAILLQGCDHLATREVAERLRTAFQGTILEIGDRSLSPTVSIGGVQIGEKIASTQQVLAKCGQCLQDAVTEGGNRSILFDPAARDRAEEERIRSGSSAFAGARRRRRSSSTTADHQLHGDGGESIKCCCGGGTDRRDRQPSPLPDRRRTRMVDRSTAG